ncbi:MAG: hypothetical protein ACI8TQ_001505 [Planctomycetota bacterium]|jgi:hypothetical protein
MPMGILSDLITQFFGMFDPRLLHGFWQSVIPHGFTQYLRSSRKLPSHYAMRAVCVDNRSPGVFNVRAEQLHCKLELFFNESLSVFPSKEETDHHVVEYALVKILEHST